MTYRGCPECQGRSVEIGDLGTVSYRRCLDCGVDFMSGSEEFEEAMVDDDMEEVDQ